MPFLREAGVLDDRRLDRPVLLDGGQHLGADHGEHRRIRPVGFGSQVVQRPMGRLNPPRLNANGYWLDALALTRQQQARFHCRPMRMNRPPRASCLQAYEGSVVSHKIFINQAYWVPVALLKPSTL